MGLTLDARRWGVLLVLAACARESNLPPPPPQVSVLPTPTARARLPETVVGLYTRACDGGSAVGCSNLGIVFSEGRDGATRDDARAQAMFQRACDLGSPAGCGNLGALLRSSDEVRAIGLLTRSCDASWVGAGHRRAATSSVHRARIAII
ncbi:MAG TPA: hypothetical protein VKU41_30845 [Polyangiaceae bacterium]|nr:hypothetical protein [Polyangiaceae bacterium]